MGIYLALFAVVLLVAYFYQGNMPQDAATVKEVPLSEFIQHLENEEIKEINQTDTKLTGKLDEKTTVYAYVNSSIELMTIWDTYVYPQMLEGKIETVESDPPDTGSVFLNLLPTIVMVLALIFLFYFMMNQGGNGKAFQFAKSRAKMVKGGDKKVTFKDVAGLDEENRNWKKW